MSRMRKRTHAGTIAEGRIDGLIVAAFGRHYEVDTARGRLQCYPRGKKSSVGSFRMRSASPDRLSVNAPLLRRWR